MGAIRFPANCSLVGAMWCPGLKVGSIDIDMPSHQTFVTDLLWQNSSSGPISRIDRLIDKKQLRKEMLARRDSVSLEARIEKSLAMAGFAEEITFTPGTVISGFLPIQSEPDLRPMLAGLRERGARLCLPVVIDSQTILFRDFVRGIDLVDTGFGTSGPPESAEILQPEIMLVPLSAFDDAGNRLGYGAGHYDRAIARIRAAGGKVNLIGTAFDIQKVAAIPAETHDVPLDRILTESGLRTLSVGV